MWFLTYNHSKQLYSDRNAKNGCRTLNILLTAYSQRSVICHHCPMTFLCVNEMVFLYHSGGFVPFLLFLHGGYTRVFVPLFMSSSLFSNWCEVYPRTRFLYPDIPWYSRYQCVTGTGAIYYESPWQSVVEAPDVEGEAEFQKLAKGDIGRGFTRVLFFARWVVFVRGFSRVILHGYFT